MDNLKWYWVYVPYLDPPDRQQESALKAGYGKVCFKYDVDTEIRRHKYKRCKKMADYCNAKIEEYRTKYDADEGFGDEWLYWIRFMRKMDA